MAVILGNKYQSKQRENFRKIVGVSVANEKIKPENMPRIYGGIGEVWFQGNSAAGSSTGNGGGSGSGEDPNGGGGSGSGEDPNGGGGGECICVEISDTLNPCCVSGYDCHTGTPIKIQPEPSYEPIIPCETPEPPPYDGDDTIVIAWWSHTTQDYGYELATMDSGSGAAADALQQSAETFLKITWCGAMSLGEKRMLHFAKKNGKSFEYWGEQIVNSEQCGVFAGSCIVNTGYDNRSYNLALESWNKKNKKKQYFVKDGKFYDACDPYGTPPSDEPITICDENSNQYEVSPDGTITPL